jgi:hypothetical protein
MFGLEDQVVLFVLRVVRKIHFASRLLCVREELLFEDLTLSLNILLKGNLLVLVSLSKTDLTVPLLNKLLTSRLPFKSSC